MARTINLSLRVWTKLLVSLALFLCPTHLVAQEEISDDAVKNWTIVGTGSDVLSGQQYTLVNKTLKQSIKYEKRGILGGINLGWDRSTTLGNFAIKSRGAAGAPIKYGDRVAISIQGIDEPYLRYEKRNIGINLTWSDDPIYEWIVAGGRKGRVVNTKTQVALFNTVEKDFLVYAPRGGEAINLRWYLDRNKGGFITAVKEAAWKESFGYLEKFFRR